MRKAVIIVLLVLLPSTVSACSSSGYTLIYVNGILTSQTDALHDLENLQSKLRDQFNGQSLLGYSGYNPIHLDGYGDELESISQAFGMPISDYDLDTILTQVAPEITTRKLLLVGHSQGTFYTNELYEYLVQNGVPKQSIAVYNIATPASFVAGGGTYLTSANDKVINYVRELDAEGNAPQALSANIIIPEESGYANNAWGGHFPAVYLDGAPARIVSDIKTALGELSVGTDSPGSCFTPPTLGLLYDTQKAVFAAADPAVARVDLVAFETKSTITSVADNANDILHTALSDAIFTVIPKPTAQNAASAFAVEKALYGSSMSVADYEALASGENIPEVQTPAQDPPQQQQGIATPAPLPVQVKLAENTIPMQPPPGSPQPVPTATVPISISPGFGGGAPYAMTSVPSTASSSSGPVASSSSQVPTSGQVLSTTTAVAQSSSQVIATTTLPFSVLSPTDQTTFATTSIAFTGTTSPGAIVFASFGTTSASTSADGVGDWSFALGLSAGTTSVLLSAADTSGDYSSTSTLAIGVALPPPAQLPMLVVTCPNFEGGGYFFDPSYMQAEYVDGLLRIHLRLLAPYNDGRLFHATTIVNGSDCVSLSANFGSGPPQTWLPAHIQYYSFRMSSPTHWILWDDEHDAEAMCDGCQGDIPAGVTSVSFAATIDSGASTLTTFPYPPTWP